MATALSFSLCPTCDCSVFEFYELTGRAPGVSTGYEAGLDISDYTGEIIWKTPEGEVVGNYSFPPSDDATVFAALRYDGDPNNSIVDGAYNVTYNVYDDTGALFATVTQSVVISCSLMCELEKLVDRYVTATKKDGEEIVRKVNKISNLIRMSNWLKQSGYTQKAAQLIAIAEDYV